MRRLVPLLLVAVLAGCGGSGGKQRASAAPPLVVAIGRKALAGVDLRNGARLISPTRLAIVTVGSSSCPAVPDRLVVESPDTIRLHLTRGAFRPVGHSGRARLVIHPPPNTICTADLGPTAMVVAIDPSKIDVHHRLTIRLYYYDSKKPVTRAAPPL